MIKILGATRLPIQYIGKMSGICYSSNTEDEQKNYNRGIDCLDHNHGRTFEYPDVTMEIGEYSNRMIRELYTSIVGVTRLQQSTRYVNMGKRFEEYYVPPKIAKNEKALEAYEDTMWVLKNTYDFLIAQGITKEDAGNIVPLGQHTTIVLKINLRALINLFAVRTCTRAYVEYRDFMKELRKELSGIDKEWALLCDEYLNTKCDKVGYCDELKTCGRYPLKEDMILIKKSDLNQNPAILDGSMSRSGYCMCDLTNHKENRGTCPKCGKKYFWMEVTSKWID